MTCKFRCMMELISVLWIYLFIFLLLCTQIDYHVVWGQWQDTWVSIKVQAGKRGKYREKWVRNTIQKRRFVQFTYILCPVYIHSCVRWSQLPLHQLHSFCFKCFQTVCHSITNHIKVHYNIFLQLNFNVLFGLVRFAVIILPYRVAKAGSHYQLL